MSIEPLPVDSWLGDKTTLSDAIKRKSSRLPFGGMKLFGGLDAKSVIEMLGPKWIIVGDDDRLPVTAVRPDRTTVGDLWKKSGVLQGCVCHLQTKIASLANPKFGTGVFIHPLAILTAAHCLYSDAGIRNRFADYVEVSPGLGVDHTGRKFQAYDSAVSSDISYSLEWDLAVIRLTSPVLGLVTSRGRRLPMSEVPYGDDKLVYPAGYSVGVIGYPRPSGQIGEIPLQEFRQYEASGRILEIDGWRMRYDVDTGNGQSGAPILALFPAGTEKTPAYRIVGIHQEGVEATRSRDAYNEGVRFTPSITRWIYDQIP